ncbi:hypothetical protein KSX_77370 [Ktedonospora formicarum]|uniref:Uncharacterized protein n=1 Tax=Ktedonospora formicarum TaxID=2778364 RepID=A0A8J3I4Y8_9CHLR|nr:hypothetical protein KSX_77370 [Ktedonospora formicarum]
MESENLARSRLVIHVLKPAPLSSQHEQSMLVFSSKHTCEAATIKLDRLQNLTTFSHPYTTLIRDITIPDSALCVEADTIGCRIIERGPNSPT